MGGRQQNVRKIFESMGQEETGSWTKLHIDKLHDLYSLPSITWVNKSRMVMRVGHVECMVG